MENEKKPEVPKLRNIIEEIQQKKGWTQAKLADELETKQQTVSKMTFSEEWENHWQIILNLLPLCYELDLLGPPALEHTIENIMEACRKLGPQHPEKIRVVLGALSREFGGQPEYVPRLPEDRGIYSEIRSQGPKDRKKRNRS